MTYLFNLVAFKKVEEIFCILRMIKLINLLGPNRDFTGAPVFT